MTKFRPCIDLHDGKVKQIVGGSLSDDAAALRTNFESKQSAGWFAEQYQSDALKGGHVIMLGPGNEAAAEDALVHYPGGLQIGGGITAENAEQWLQRGASKVIVTSWLFEGPMLQLPRVQALADQVGPEQLVLDLSCRRCDEGWAVCTNRWQDFTELMITRETLDSLSSFCSEFLIHAADVEGKCEGIDEDLVEYLGRWGKGGITYAGGAKAFEDLARVDQLSGGTIDLTIGSALDLFGGSSVKYRDCVEWNRKEDR
jgi:phosphoribosylformimino-5-aminoimidazole carboxamide ribotide isomerase